VEGSRKLSLAAVLTAAPAYAAGVALLAIAVLRFLGATQPGQTLGDPRPLDDASSSLGALIAGVALILLGHFAAKRPAEASSLLTTACLGAVGALLLVLGASRGHSGVLLAVGLAFAYPAAVALARLVSLRRRAAQRQHT
jgi:hypothetical protein